MNTKAAILELGVEDLPSGMAKDALAQMQKNLQSLLDKNRIKYQKVSTMGSSRRLVVHIQDIALAQEDAIHKDMGPPKAVVYNPEGKLTPAGKSYLEAKQAREEDLETQKTAKGEYVYIKRYIKGDKTCNILPSLFTELIKNLRFPKSMKWKENGLSFGRPLRYILCLLGDEVISFGIDGIISGRKTKGHRYLHPEWVEIPEVSDYWRIIPTLGVTLDPKQREEQITQQTLKVISHLQSKDYPARLNQDQELLEELSYLTEHPTVFWGNFDSKYLSLPSFILKACLREYQKYFTVTDGENVLPFFIGVRDGEDYNLEGIAQNNKRVLHGRLSDAQFFYHEDKKIPLEKRVPQLQQIIVQEKLGSYYDKVKRLVALADKVCQKLQIDTQTRKRIKRAAYLCKADLLTHMGKEFPGLQGRLGKEYAVYFEEHPVVAKAIEEHRKPRFAGDDIPQLKEGAILAIVDKIDTLTGAFWAGLIPSGSEDPWGLRREAQGVIEIITQEQLEVKLSTLIDESMSFYKGEKQQPAKKLTEFLETRFINLLRDRGVPPDHINAVMEIGKDSLVDVAKRAQALGQVATGEKFEQEVVAIVRLLNILKQAKEWGINIPLNIDHQKFEQQEELDLYNSWKNKREVVDRLLEEKKYCDAYRNLSSLREPIHAFFEEVMVMSEDQDQRVNRLSLLFDIGKRILNIADFTKLQI